jgi:hypothetical protein
MYYLHRDNLKANPTTNFLDTADNHLLARNTTLNAYIAPSYTQLEQLTAEIKACNCISENPTR